MNLDNLIALQKAEKSHRLSMRHIWEHFDKDEGEPTESAANRIPWSHLRRDIQADACGTAGCHAGWCCVIAAKRRPADAWDWATKWLALTSDDMAFNGQDDFLFMGSTHQKYGYHTCTDTEARVRLEILIEAARNGEHDITLDKLIARLNKCIPKGGWK